MYHRCVRADAHAEGEKCLGELYVVELWDVFVDVTMQTTLSFGSEAQNLCFAWVEMQVGCLCDDAEYGEDVTSGKYEVASCYCKVVAVCSDDAVVWSDGCGHESYDGVHGVMRDVMRGVMRE